MKTNSKIEVGSASVVDSRPVPSGASGSQDVNLTSQAGTAVKVISKRDLLAIRKYEEERGYLFNQRPSDFFLKQMPADRLLPVLDTFIHNDVEVRCVVPSQHRGDIILVDMPFEIHDRLQEMNGNSDELVGDDL